MKSELSSIELHYLVKELQLLLDAKIDKIFQPDKRELIFQTHSASQGKKLLRIVLPSLLYITEIKPESPKKPFGYCMYLRKHISNARIRSIEQHKSERIITILLEKKEGKFYLIFELFSKGNIILCDEELNILSPLERQIWKDREVKPKAKYIFPEREINIFKLKEEEFKELLKNSDKESIVKTLATDLGLGGTYAEEICLQSDIKKDLKRLTEEQKTTLYKTFQSFLKKKVKANTINNEIFPLDLMLNKDKTPTFYDSFNHALDSIFSKQVESKKVSEQDSKYLNQKKKYELIIKKQRQQTDTMEKGIEENQQKGELIYNNYQKVDDIIKQIKQAKKKLSYKEIQAKLKEKGIELNEKEKSITLDI